MIIWILIYQFVFCFSYFIYLVPIISFELSKLHLEGHSLSCIFHLWSIYSCWVLYMQNRQTALFSATQTKEVCEIYQNSIPHISSCLANHAKHHNHAGWGLCTVIFPEKASVYWCWRREVKGMLVSLWKPWPLCGSLVMTR